MSEANRSSTNSRRKKQKKKRRWKLVSTHLLNLTPATSAAAGPSSAEKRPDRSIWCATAALAAKEAAPVTARVLPRLRRRGVAAVCKPRAAAVAAERPCAWAVDHIAGSFGEGGGVCERTEKVQMQTHCATASEMTSYTCRMETCVKAISRRVCLALFFENDENTVLYGSAFSRSCSLVSS